MPDVYLWQLMHSISVMNAEQILCQNILKIWGMLYLIKMLVWGLFRLFRWRGVCSYVAANKQTLLFDNLWWHFLRKLDVWGTLLVWRVDIKAQVSVTTRLGYVHIDKLHCWGNGAKCNRFECLELTHFSTLFTALFWSLMSSVVLLKHCDISQ